MSGFNTYTGKIAVYNEDDVDTDRIIPARFLSRISRTGYGELLFSDVRNDSFALDQENAQGASILIVGKNFGCGSSREHAVWAIQQAGFKAIISCKTSITPGFSDIFRQNSANCGLLLVELEQEHHKAFVNAGSGAEVTVDLPNQYVEINGEKHSFEINEVIKAQLVAGLDLIGTTLENSTDIAQFEKKWGSLAPQSQMSDEQRQIWVQMIMHRASKSRS